MVHPHAMMASIGRSDIVPPRSALTFWRDSTERARATQSPGRTVQELREEGPTRRREGNRKFDRREGHTTGACRESARNETREQRDDSRNHESEATKIHEIRVITRTVVILDEIDQAEPRGEDEQNQGGYRHQAPPTAEELAVLHGLSVLMTCQSKASASTRPGAIAM